MSSHPTTARRRLDAEWTVACLIAGVTALGGRDAIAAAAPGAGNRWLLVAGAVLCYEMGYLRYHLRRNRSPEGALRPSLGLSNAVTLVRGGLYAATAGFLLVPPSTPAVRWAPAICYGAGAILDAVDGAVARRVGETTELGARLDLAFDTLGFLVAPLVGVAWGRLPVWYLSISAARFLYRGGVGLHRLRGGPVREPPDSRLRRPLAALQMGFIAVALAPLLPARIVDPAAAIVAAPSLTVFLRDYLAVTGRPDRTAVEGE